MSKIINEKNDPKLIYDACVNLIAIGGAIIIFILGVTGHLSYPIDEFINDVLGFFNVTIIFIKNG